MQNKSNSGQTKKYSGIVNSVKKDQTPEEPRITQEQVIAAFKSFGFEPNERNHNDIGYWTTKGQSEGVKLMEELHKRRMEINQKEDDDKKKDEDLKNQQDESKRTLPRLSDEDIAALFDEYGLPTPDPEWARTHLPNDPKKIRSILEMQRKMADDMLKKHSKNSVNSIPETPKMQAGGMSTPTTAPMPMGGMGGPLNAQAGMTGFDEPVTPFFVGENALVKITNPNNPNSGTLWLVDSKKKVLRPILSEKALENAFEDPQEAMNSIITLSSKALGPGGPLEGFTPLKADKAMNDDGSMEDIEFSEAQLQNRYGKPSDQVSENKALSMLDGMMNNLNTTQ
jgi:hypothetical protein